MENAAPAAGPPEHNVTGMDYADPQHLRYAGPPIIDVHAHVLRTRPSDPPNGPPSGSGPDASLAQAERMFEVAQEFNVRRIATMCFPEAIPPLRGRFGNRIGSNGSTPRKQ